MFLCVLSGFVRFCILHGDRMISNLRSLVDNGSKGVKEACRGERGRDMEGNRERERQKKRWTREREREIEKTKLKEIFFIYRDLEREHPNADVLYAPAFWSVAHSVLCALSYVL